MGEAKLKKATHQEIRAKEPRCIYCEHAVETIDHMPPICMFRERQRPSGMEYGSCQSCNGGARGSDVVAAVFALLHPDYGPGSWQAAHVRKLISALDQFAPGVREELSAPGKSNPLLLRRPSGLLKEAVQVHADGPRTTAYLKTFGVRLAMALYREHVGEALPLDGAVWCQFALNAGMRQEHLDARISILPAHETLKQGRKQVGEQFAYRYNSDERSVVAAVAQFHKGLWMTLFASSEPRTINLMSRPEFNELPASVLASPGKLRTLLPCGFAGHAV